MITGAMKGSPDMAVGGNNKESLGNYPPLDDELELDAKKVIKFIGDFKSGS